MSLVWKVTIGSVVALAALLGLLLVPARPTEAPEKLLMVHCAAVMASPMERIAAAYERETGVRVQLQFGGSGALLSGIKVSRQGDLFLAADQSYLDLARGDKLIVASMDLVRLTPVIAVPKGNPKGIGGIDALAQEGVRVSLANPDAASIGRVIKEALVKRGLWDAVEANVRKLGVFKPSVNDVANDVKLGAADVGVVWDAVLLQYPELEAVKIDGAELLTQSAGLGVLATTRRRNEARRFMQYVAASDRGLEVLKGLGYSVVEGKPWATE